MSEEANCPKIDTCTYSILEENYERACLGADGKQCPGVNWVGRTWPRYWKQNRCSVTKAKMPECPECGGVIEPGQIDHVCIRKGPEEYQSSTPKVIK